MTSVPDDTGDELSDLARDWVSSELKVQVLAFFHKNPGLVETIEGLARRMGTAPDRLEREIASQVELGILKKRRMGDATVIMYDRAREGQVQALFEERIRERLEGENT